MCEIDNHHMSASLEMRANLDLNWLTLFVLMSSSDSLFQMMMEDTEEVQPIISSSEFANERAIMATSYFSFSSFKKLIEVYFIKPLCNLE